MQLSVELAKKVSGCSKKNMYKPTMNMGVSDSTCLWCDSKAALALSTQYTQFVKHCLGHLCSDSSPLEVLNRNVLAVHTKLSTLQKHAALVAGKVFLSSTVIP